MVLDFLKQDVSFVLLKIPKAQSTFIKNDDEEIIEPVKKKCK